MESSSIFLLMFKLGQKIAETAGDITTRLVKELLLTVRLNGYSSNFVAVTKAMKMTSTVFSVPLLVATSRELSSMQAHAQLFESFLQISMNRHDRFQPSEIYREFQKAR